MNSDYLSATDIAIIGMAGKFPDAKNIEEFWENIINTKNSIKNFTDEELTIQGIEENLLKDKNYVKSKGYLENSEYFDADFFKFSKHEAEILDPQYRLFFEIAWEALENSAYVPENYKGKIGIFASSSNIDTYYNHNLFKSGKSSLHPDNFTIMLHNAKDFLSNLLAYKLKLCGPAITVQTACSSSLVAICMACQSLLSFESDMVLAGGVCITMPLKSGYLFQEGMMLSPTGKCSTFDKNADGIVMGNGLGVVVLKRLNEAMKDGDYIHAIIKGTSVNNDGGNKIGFTAPSVAGQQAVIESALNKANIKPDMLSYIETHGTGTILGDLIEVEALTRIFKEHTREITLGSVKPNIGHLDAAAGVANLIKVTQALKYKILPPNLNFHQSSPQLKLAQTPFKINIKPVPWLSHNLKRYAGVSAFGIGGTNAHVILTEAPEKEESSNPREKALLVISAKTPDVLIQIKRNLASFLFKNKKINLSDVAYTLQVGRKNFHHREAFICLDIEDAISQLNSELANIKENPDDTTESLKEISIRWLSGELVDWSILHDKNKRSRVPLPTYPFERKKHWIVAPNLKLPKFKSVTENTSSMASRDTPDLTYIEKKIKTIFERFFTKDNIDTTCNFDNLGGDSLVALLITHEINTILNVKLPFSIYSNNLSIEKLSLQIANHIENS